MTDDTSITGDTETEREREREREKLGNEQDDR